MVLLILALPPLLFVLGIGAVLVPFGGVGYATGFGFAMIALVVELGLMIAALPGLFFARKMSGWQLLFYAQVASFVFSVLSGSIVGALFGASDRHVPSCFRCARCTRRERYDVFFSGSSRMNQLSQSVREPPASVTVNRDSARGSPTAAWRGPLECRRGRASAGCRRIVVAVLVLHAFEDRELAPRAHVDFELRRRR